MIKIPALFMVGAITFAGVRITYDPFTSTIYPYRVLQPSSFRHIVVLDLTGHGVDYFYPDLGSFVTNVNIYAVTPGQMKNQAQMMHPTGAKHVHISGYLRVDKKRVPIFSSDHRAFPGHWREETAQFSSGGMIWHVTISYLLRYRNLRPVMMRMIRSFHIR
ncbi:MAG: hypothetical protein NVS2B16_01920 [Chloroflexota bacterium]